MAQAHFRPAPGASAVSTMQAARPSGAVPAWIHPRNLGLTAAMTPLALVDAERFGGAAGGVDGDVNDMGVGVLLGGAGRERGGVSNLTSP